jgi:hypothetical protein
MVKKRLPLVGVEDTPIKKAVASAAVIITDMLKRDRIPVKPIYSVREWLQLLDVRQQAYPLRTLYRLYWSDRRVKKKVSWENFEHVISFGL